MNRSRGTVSAISNQQILLCIAVAALILLTGCSGVLSDTDDDRDPFGVNNETTLEVENRSPENETVNYLAPGLTAEGVENVSLLRDRHFDALERDSENGTYTIREYSNTSVNGTLVSESYQETVAEYPMKWRETFTGVNHVNGTETIVYDSWVTTSEALHKMDVADEPVQYTAGQPPDEPGHPPELDTRIESMLSSVSVENNVTVETRTRDDQTWYVVKSSYEPHADVPGHDNIRMKIRDDGFIEHIDGTRVRETWDSGEEITEFGEWHIKFTTTQNATLDRPDWLEEAHNETSDEPSE